MLGDFMRTFLMVIGFLIIMDFLYFVVKRFFPKKKCVPAVERRYTVSLRKVNFCKGLRYIPAGLEVYELYVSCYSCEPKKNALYGLKLNDSKVNSYSVLVENPGNVDEFEINVLGDEVSVSYPNMRVFRESDYK